MQALIPPMMIQIDTCIRNLAGSTNVAYLKNRNPEAQAIAAQASHRKNLLSLGCSSSLV